MNQPIDNQSVYLARQDVTHCTQSLPHPVKTFLTSSMFNGIDTRLAVEYDFGWQRRCNYLIDIARRGNHNKAQNKN